MNNAISSVASILAVIAIGFVLAKRGWFPGDFPRLLSRLVVDVSLPALMVTSLGSQIDPDAIATYGIGAVVPFLLIGGMYALSFLFCRALAIPSGTRGVFRSVFTFSNSIFLGMPVNIAIFGAEAAQYVVFYYLSNTLLFWTIGIYGIRKDSGGEADSDGALFTAADLSHILSPALLAVAFSIALKFLGVGLPAPLVQTLTYLGNLTTPLSMLFIGTVIAGVGLRSLALNRTIVLLAVMRFAVLPAAMILAVRFLPVPTLMKQVFVLEAAMPVMTQTAIAAKAYGSNDRFASIMITVTTACSIIVIPFYAALFGFWPQLVS